MIYGGSTSTDIPGQRLISYPSGNLFGHAHGDTGVILGYYPIGGASVPVSNMSIAERVKFALAAGEKIHPGNYRKHFTGEAMSVAWQKCNMHLRGGKTGHVADEQGRFLLCKKATNAYLFQVT